MKKIAKIILFFLIVQLVFAIPIGSDYGRADSPVLAIPGGEAIGLKMYLDGLLVVGFSDIASDGRKVSPARSSGLRKGDRIVKVGGENVQNIQFFSQKIQESGGFEVILTLERDNEALEIKVTPAYYNDAGQYKLGAWVRDSAAGIGTVSFVLEDGSFASLGHGISDADTEELITVASGEVTGSNITSVVKGRQGVPGELRGAFDNSAEGKILFNNESGVYGRLERHTLTGEPMEIAREKDVTEGEAYILSSIDGGKTEAFDVSVQKVMRFNNSDGKCMVIKVTDSELLERTGGIVQGMSGSPVIKDGKIIGVVTHVFLNDPTQGYAIFAERMLNVLLNGKN